MTNRIRKWLFGAVMITLAACGGDSGSDSTCAGDKCDELTSGWVVDLGRTSTYGGHSEYFWGLSLEELGLSELAAAIDGSGLEAAATQAFQPFGAEAATFKIVWDQVQSVAPGWPTVVFPSIAKANEGIPGLNAALPQLAEGLAAAGVKYEEGMQYRIILIDQQRRALAVPGGLRIIPMLQNTDPNEQKHIKAALDDGDVISYVHPEQSDMAALMERRASHVAMHYEEGETMHHIDNPDGYGPPYNHKPNRHMPFHAFRYQPKNMEAELAKQYRRAARNWAFVTNDLSPFADFFDLRLKTYSDLDSFSGPAVRNEDIPNLYCSGLAYTNLNLGVNKPQNAAGLGQETFNTFSDSQYFFGDMEKHYSGASLTAPASLNGVGELVFEPYTSLDMLNVWVGNAFRGLPPALHQQFLPQFLKSPALHTQIGQSLTQLSWSDADGDNDYYSDDWVDVATTFNVAAWATAYSMQLEGKTAADFVNVGLKVTDSEGNTKPLKDIVDGKLILNPTTKPLQVMDDLYKKVVSNRFVPPRIWLDKGQTKPNNVMERPNTPRNMKYLGTVINCELLKATDGTDADACAGGGLGVREYAEGGADTHTYSHYAVRNGGVRTHRRINASSGPEFFGPGTVATVRMTGNVADTSFALHVPEQWLQLPNHTNDSITEFDRFCNQQWEAGASCSPTKGIFLDPSKMLEVGSGIVHNEEMKFSLVGEAHSPCTVIDDNTLSCQIINLQSSAISTEKVSRRAHGGEGMTGLFSATMLDNGTDTSVSDCTIRAQLDSANPGAASGCMSEMGSGHFDVFHIKVANQAEASFEEECECAAECADSDDEDCEDLCMIDCYGHGEGQEGATPGWCEVQYEDCMTAVPAPKWQKGEECLTTADEQAEEQFEETCEWAYNGDYEANPVPSCFPQGSDGDAGRCVHRTLCDEKQQSEGTTAYSGFCPGPDDVQCCVGLDAAGG